MQVFATPSSATAQDDRTCSHRTVEEGQAKEEEEEQEEEDEEGSRAGQRCPHRAETLGTGGKLVVTTGDFDGTGTEAHGVTAQDDCGFGVTLAIGTVSTVTLAVGTVSTVWSGFV
jgi:hypothetical protein